MALFFLVFLVLLGAVYGYPAWRLLSDLQPAREVAWAWSLLAVAAALLPLLYLRALRSVAMAERLRRGLAWLTFGSFGGAIVLFNVVLARDVLTLFVRWTPTWPVSSAALCLPAAALLSLFALHVAHRTPPVRHVDIAIDDLPAPLDGLRLVQFSDLHVGPTIRRGFVERLVQRLNDLQPDVVLFTGDLTDGTVEDLRSQVAPLADLRARLGIYACTGNHDYYWDAAGWMAAWPDLGLRPLCNEHVVLPVDGAHLVIGGLPDPTGAEALPGQTRHAGDAQAVFAGAPAGPRILLAHQPAVAAAAQAAGADLTLSGHTHGGQMIPWSLFVRLQQPVVAGLRRHPDGQGWIYVNRGAGYWGPPMRLGPSSEITCLTLRRARPPA